ncbi:MAG: quinon protein alcohol dehydrogenase-like superfamily [Benniella sp.]|nr:MAG: quinon protein alcohol dehydrogenase-like superfamily [Benniella sp.]
MMDPFPNRGEERQGIAVIPEHIFLEKVQPPSIEFKPPESGERLKDTLQLAYCLSLLRNFHSTDETMKPAAHKWLHAIEKDHDEQERLRALAIGVIRAFKRDEKKDAKVVAEIVSLAPALRLAQLIQGATPGYLDTDDLVKILDLLTKRLRDMYRQSTHHMHQLILAVLGKRVQEEPLFKEQLFAYIELSKKDKKWRTAAANAITILVRAGVQFIETDLQGIQIPGADLSYGVFDPVKLKEADLRKVDLRGVWMWQTDLSRAHLSGAKFGELPFLADEVTVDSCAYSPDGESITVGLNDGSIRVYATSDWKKKWTLSGHVGACRCVGYSPDSAQIASGGDDMRVRLWNVETGNCEYVLIAHHCCVLGITYSPKGDHVASASSDRTVNIWEVVTGECIQVCFGHDRGVLCVAGFVWGVVYSPQGDRIASASEDTTVRLWNVEEGSCLHVLSGHSCPAYCISYSPGGEQVASGSMDGDLRVWDAETGICHTTLLGHVNSITCVVFSPKSDRIASGSGDRTLRIWDISAGESRFDLIGHSSAATCVKSSPNGDLIAFASEDTSIRLWDVETGNHLSGSRDGSARLWDVKTGFCLRILAGHEDRVNAVAYSPQGRRVASASDDNTVRVWSVAIGECLMILLDHTDGVLSVAYSPDGSRIATSSKDQTILVWDAETGDLCQILEGHTNWARDVAYSPQGDQLASVGYDNTIRLWDVETGECLSILIGHIDRVKSVVYSPKGHLLATGSWDRTVRLWDVRTKECRAEIRNFEDAIHGIAWDTSSGGNRLVTGCGDGSVLKWDVIEEEEHCHVSLSWSAKNGALTVTGATVQDVRGLSRLNMELLVQRGAVDHSYHSHQRPPAMTTVHALELPEIAFRIVDHLDIQDLVSISAICRSFRASFAPYLWQDIRFGAIPTSTSKEPRYLPSKKFISIKNSLLSTTNQDTNHVSAASLMAKVSQDLQNATQWIRSIAIHSHDSLLPLAFGASCNRLETIHLRALSIHSQRHTDAHWTFCKKMLQQNRPHLKSLLLFGWETMYRDISKPARGRPVWNPILKCSQAWNLRSLVMADCRIRGRHMGALWTVCQRLERLVLDNVVLHSTRPDVLINNSHATRVIKNIPGLSQAMSLLSCQTSALFPRIKELEFRRLTRIPLLSLLNDIIRHCPALQSLNWDQGLHRPCIAQSFLHLMEAGTWPDLNTIIVYGGRPPLASATYTRMVRAVRRSLRQLTFDSPSIEEDTFQAFRTLHFSTLEELDLMRCSGSTDAWAVQVLTSCPRLRWFRAKGINAQDLLSPGEGSRPWICHGLEELYISIDMGFKDNGANRQMTDEELGQCRAVFRKLASLKELRVLDTRTTQIPTRPEYPYRLQHPSVPLPIRLKAGLDELKTLTRLETFHFWCGRHVIYRKEIEWMVDHWKRLRAVAGGWMVPVDSTLRSKFTLIQEMGPWLKKRGVTTIGRFYEDDLDWEAVSHDFEDCCGESQVGAATVIRAQVKKP